MHISHKLQLFPYGPPIAAALHLHTSLSHRKKKGNSLLHSCAFFAVRILSENFGEFFAFILSLSPIWLCGEREQPLCMCWKEIR